MIHYPVSYWSFCFRWLNMSFNIKINLTVLHMVPRSQCHFRWKHMVDFFGIVVRVLAIFSIISSVLVRTCGTIYTHNIRVVLLVLHFPSTLDNLFIKICSCITTPIWLLVMKISFIELKVWSVTWARFHGLPCTIAIILLRYNSKCSNYFAHTLIFR